VREGTVVVGLDLGTTSAKAIAYDVDGRPWGEAGREYPLSSPRPGTAEQDPDEVRDAAVAVLGTAVRRARQAGARVVGVAVSAALHSLLALGADGRPLTPVLTYADTRAAAEAARLRDSGRGLPLYRRTGAPVHPMTPLTKLRWFADHDPGTARAARRWVSLKEYVVAHLTGSFVVDHSVASGTGLFDLRARDWDAEALDYARVERAQLSQPVPTTEVRTLGAEAAAALGLDAGLPLVIGAADGCLANLGSGATSPDVAAVTIATSGAVRVVTAEPRTDPDGRLFCYALTEDRWVVGGAISNGGLALRWYRDHVLPDVAAQARAEGADPYDRLVELALTAPPGGDGLLFLPFLTGERAPHWDAVPRGVLFGLDLRHGRADLVRAALEGPLLQLRWVLAALEDNGIVPREVRANGGFTRSAAWLQLLADVFARRITVPERGEATCLGAALLGAVALGLVPSLDVAAGAVRTAGCYDPRPELAGVYRTAFTRYRDLYDALAGPFAQLGAAVGSDRGAP
jgi:gluconokinase